MSYYYDYDYRANDNCNGLRHGRIKGVCLHHSAGTTLNMTPTFLQHNTSAHYGIKLDHVRQFMEDESTVWATGTNDGNNNYINIECVNSAVGGDWPIDELTIDTLVEFLGDKAKAWGITKYVAGVNLKGHRDFSATYCPGVLYPRLTEIAERANEAMRPKGWDEMATKQEIKEVCYEAARDAVWEQRENIADAVFSKDIEGKPFYWRAQQGSDASYYANEHAQAANEALHVTDPTGRCDMPPLEQLRYMAQKQAHMQEQIDHIEQMLAMIINEYSIG